MKYLEIKNQIIEKLAVAKDFEDTQNLLELGLNSLQIMRLVNQWRKMGICVQFGELMENPTFENWKKKIQAGIKPRNNKRKKKSEGMGNVKTGTPFALTDVQYAYKIGRADDQELGGIGCHAYLEFSGRDVEAERLKKAWETVQYHHPMLRAKFLDDGRQEIMDKPFEESMIINDLREEKDVEKRLQEIRDSLSHRKLVVEKGQVAGISLSLLPKGKTRIHFDLDLLVADVQSLQILLRDLATAYHGGILPEESKDWSFARYLDAQRDEEKTQREQVKKYWKNRLHDFPLGPELPLAKAPAQVKDIKFCRRVITLQKKEWQKLQQKAAQNKATPAMLLLSAYALVLERFSSTKRFLINIPFFHRNTEEKGLEEVVADFTTLLLLEVDMRKQQTFKELLEAVQRQVHQDMKYTAYSGVQVQRDLAHLHGTTQTVAPVVFACNLGTPLVNKEFKNSLGELSDMISQTPQVWMDFQIYEDETGLMLAWDTVDELFYENMVDDMFSSLGTCLHQLRERDWDQYFDILPEYQKEFIEKQCKVEPEKNPSCLHTSFLHYAKKNPKAIAIIDTGEKISITYETLKKEALSVAAFLIKNKVRKTPIVMSIPRGYKQMIAVLGILLSENFYVPVSYNQPIERRKLIHQKTGIHIMITDKAWDLKECPENTTVLFLEDMRNEGPVKDIPDIKPEDVAYLIMTSGTTGLPKGVEITHKGAWNTVSDVNNRVGITENDSILGVSAMDFDLSVYDLFGMLGGGGKLVLIPEEKSKDAEYWMHQIVKYNITVWNSVPVLLDMLLIHAETQGFFLPLRAVMLSGDWIGMDLPERVAAVTRNCRFIAMGGATEASIWSNWIDVKLPLPAEWHSIPYGRPLSHQTYRVVGENGIDAPFWTPGELWIGGCGVGVGYRGDEEFTRKKFPIDIHGKWYRTGDKGRFWSDGTIEFLGREDFQVKIRGHRIELGEIETALKGVEGVHNAIVEASSETRGDKHLIAYLETGKVKQPPLYLEDKKMQQEVDEKWKRLSQAEYNCKDTKNKEFEAVLKYGNQKSCELILETLKSLGVFRNGETSYTYDEILSLGKISKNQQETVKKWLSDLVEDKMLEKRDEAYTLLPKEGRKTIIKTNTGKKINSYLENLKGYMPDLISGKKNPVEVFYAEGQKLAPNDLLLLLPGAKDIMEELVSRLKMVVESIKAERTIRVLEIGTRDIKLTKTIVASLANMDIAYTYADSSLFFINEAKKSLEQYPFVTYEMLHLEDMDSIAIGETQKYDCIFLVNAFHRMKNLQMACKNVTRLLTWSGNLLLLELTVNTYLQDITASILENGDHFNSIRSAEEWKEILTENGFQRVCSFPEDRSFCGRNIILAMPRDTAMVLDAEFIKEFLKEKLPEYMIPKVYNSLEKLPLNSNGKVDKKALHQLEAKEYKKEPKKEATTDIEKKLCNIWENIFHTECIGVMDNYFVLGGDSLIATRLLANIREKFQVNLTISDIFGITTVLEQAKYIDDLQKENVLQTQTIELPQIIPDKKNENVPFGLTSVQQAYWIGRSGVYELGQVSTHCFFELDCRDINISKLQDTWNQMIMFHGMMRIVISPNGKQKILKSVPEYKIMTVHLDTYEESAIEKELLKIREQMSHQVITTDTWPLFDVRATVLKSGITRIHISFDNLIFDGFSMFHLLHEWAERYRDEYVQMPELELSFRDYVLGLEKIKESELYERDKKYWNDRIHTFAAAPELPLAKKENDIVNQKFCRRSAYLSQIEWSSLKETVKEQGITPSVLLITAYAEVLRKWSSNMEFTLNLTQFNRKPLHPQVNQLVGDFTTLTLLEIKNNKEENFANRAKKVQRQLMEDLEHTFYSAVDVERELKKENKNQRGSIMPVVFTSGLGVDNWNEGKWLGKLIYNVSQTPQVWLDHQVIERDGELCLFWDSVDELFYPGMLDEMFSAYVSLLRRLANETDSISKKSISLVHVPISKERQKANQTKMQYKETTLDGLFIDAVKKYPYHIAVVNREYRLTYKEVKEKALYICQQLQDMQVSKEEMVAVLMEKSWKQIISVYGILFRGAAYLPLDIQNPIERLQKILKDSITKIILVEREYFEKNQWLNEWNCIIVNGERRETDASIIASKQMDSLAYTIYTSGSTGDPKGVMISHKGALNTILDMNARYGVTQQDSVLALSNLHFDLSVYDIFGVLGCGGTVIIPDSEKIKDPGHWIDLMNKEKITLWNSVPTFMEMLMEYQQGHRNLIVDDIRLVWMSGDWIPKTLPEKIYQYFKNAKVVSLGGATEASIWSNAFDIPKKIPWEWKSIPYGKPLSNQKYYILDEFMQCRPDWVPGMLYIAGTGTAIGYLNDPKKTQESFIFWPETGERLYCTGDMGRYWPNGDIEFLGREDSQVKISGFRVELGEIRNAVNKIDGIKDGMVAIDKTNSHPSVVLVVLCDKYIKEEEISAQLKKVLPSYMIPETILTLEEYPLSNNGKIDQQKIIEISRERKQQTALKKSRLPMTEKEKKVFEIWKELLGYENVTMEDNFFACGGNSLQAIKLVNRLSILFDQEITIDCIFENPSPIELAFALEQV